MRAAMRMSAPLNVDRGNGHGFTLVEILVVVLIIGILLTFASLSIGDRALAERVETESRRMEQLFRLALEDAELKGYEIGFRLTDTRYEFLVIGPEGQWVPMDQGPLRPRLLTAPLLYALRVDGRAVPPARENPDKKIAPEPQVLLLSSGEATAFSLDFSATGAPLAYRIEADALGRIQRTPQEIDT